MKRPGILTSALLLCALGTASLITFSEILIIGPRALIETEYERNGRISAEHQASILGALELAGRLTVSHPEIAYQMALLNSLVVEGESETQRRQRLERAISHLHDALQARPGWAPAWVEMAVVQLKLKRYLKAKSALIRAFELHPYESGVQRRGLQVAFSIWGILDYAEKDRVMLVIKHVLDNYYPQWAIDPAVHYGREDLITHWVKPGTRAAQRLVRQRELRAASAGR